MRKALKLRFDGKVFYPEEEVDFPLNSHLTVFVKENNKEKDNKTFIKIIKRAKNLGISDLSKQHNHYLYGTEKI